MECEKGLKMIKLDIGSGRNPEPGNYKRLDTDPQFNPDFLCDIEKEPIPIEDGQVEEIVINHCLEHISWRKHPEILTEFHRILCPSGILKIRVPDFEYICKTYLEKGPITDEWPADMEAMKGIYGKWGPWEWANVKAFSGQEESWNFHKVGFDFQALKTLLESAGFGNVVRHGEWTIHSPGELQVSCEKKSLARDYPKDSDPISFIIPTVGQNGPSLIDGCIRSMLVHEPGLLERGHEIIVVEDGSDATIQGEVRRVCERQGCIYLERKENEGFSRAVNDGLERSTGTYCVLVNSDVRFTQGFVDSIRGAFQRDKNIAIVGALLTYENGQIQHGGMEWDGRWINHIARNGFLHDWPGLKRGRYRIGVTGALFCIKRAFYEKFGGLSTLYKLSCEDADYCLKAWSTGFRVWYEPTLKAVHFEGGSRGALPSEKAERPPKWRAWEEESFSIFKNRMKTTDVNSLQIRVDSANAELYPKSPAVTTFKRYGALGDVILTTGVIRKYCKDHPNEVLKMATLVPHVFRDLPFVLEVASHPEQTDYDKLIDLDLAYERRPNLGIVESYCEVAGVNDPDQPVIYSRPTDLYSLRLKFPNLDLNSGKLVVVHMANTWNVKTWPKSSWGDLLFRLTSAGYDVAIVGAGYDFRAPNTQRIYNLAGNAGEAPLSIQEIRELIDHAQLFIGMDSGIMHVAMSTATPIIGIFTIADPKHILWHRFQGITRAISPNVECRFCLHRALPPVTGVECTNEKEPLICLKKIEPKTLFDEAIKILKLPASLDSQVQEEVEKMASYTTSVSRNA